MSQSSSGMDFRSGVQCGHSQCPSCRRPLCPHGVCRQCSICEECDRVKAMIDAVPVRRVPRMVVKDGTGNDGAA